MSVPEPATILLPPDAEDIARWEESARRRRMLDGTWGADLLAHMAATLGVLRTDSIGRPSRAVNLFRSAIDQLACHYDRPGVLRHESGDEAGDAMAALYERGHLWPLLARHERYALGLREALIRVGWSATLEAPALRLVPADTVVVRCAPGDVADIREIREARWRDVSGTQRQVWDVWSLDDERGLWLEDERGRDITAEVLGELPEYEWVDEQGERYLPWLLSHAQPTGQLWDAYAWCELVDGAFDVGVAWNHWHKLLRDSAWRQKYGIGITVAGGITRGEGMASARHVTTAPDSILLLDPTTPGTAGAVGTFDAPASASEVGDAILAFQRTLISTVGIHPADVERTEGGASSGYAIQLRRSAQRRLAMSSESVRRSDDVTLLRLVALEATRQGQLLPTEGWSIAYQYPDEGAAEQQERLTLQQNQVAAGLLTPVEMYQSWHPGVSDDAAFRALLDGAAQRMALQPEAVQRLLAENATTVDDARALAADMAAEDVAEESTPPAGEEVDNGRTDGAIDEPANG